MPRGSQKIAALALALLLGLSASSLIRQLFDRGKVEDVEAAAIRAANEALVQERERHEVLISQNVQLEERRKTLLRRLEESEDVGGVLEAMRENALLSGMTDVQGQGLVLTLDDRLHYDPLTDPIEALIHDSTVNYVINLLWSAGARAIAFHGIRLTAVSEISCVGPTILCYGVRQMPPYIFEVIGPEEELRKALEGDSYLAHLTQARIGVRLGVVSSGQLSLPSFSRTHDFAAYIDLLRTP